MSTEDRLIYMANQIARNLASQGANQAATMMRDHLRDFWDPAMRQRIVALASDRPEAFSPIAAVAVSQLSAP